MKYMIDYLYGSGSGCDDLFDSVEDAKNHMSFWTPEEREGCVIVPLSED